MNGASSINNTYFSSTSLFAVVSAAPVTIVKGSILRAALTRSRSSRDTSQDRWPFPPRARIRDALSLARPELLKREHTLLPRFFYSRLHAIRANARKRLNCQLRDSINNATTHTNESSPAILVLSTPASPPMKSPRESWFYRVSRGAREREKYNKSWIRISKWTLDCHKVIDTSCLENNDKNESRDAIAYRVPNIRGLRLSSRNSRSNFRGNRARSLTLVKRSGKTSAAFLSYPFAPASAYPGRAHVRHTPRAQSLLPARCPSCPFSSRSTRSSFPLRSACLLSPYPSRVPSTFQ